MKARADHLIADLVVKDICVWLELLGFLFVFTNSRSEKSSASRWLEVDDDSWSIRLMTMDKWCLVSSNWAFSPSSSSLSCPISGESSRKSRARKHECFCSSRRMAAFPGFQLTCWHSARLMVVVEKKERTEAKELLPILAFYRPRGRSSLAHSLNCSRDEETHTKTKSKFNMHSQKIYRASYWILCQGWKHERLAELSPVHFFP